MAMKPAQLRGAGGRIEGSPQAIARLEDEA